MTEFTREDYEMAAKAAGLIVEWIAPSIGSDKAPYIRVQPDIQLKWSPIEFTSDAYRLLATLGCGLMHIKEIGDVFILDERLLGECIAERYRDHSGNVEQAMKVVIFRAAIAIGRAMP
jgi:hypothetical protein